MTNWENDSTESNVYSIKNQIESSFYQENNVFKIIHIMVQSYLPKTNDMTGVLPGLESIPSAYIHTRKYKTYKFIFLGKKKHSMMKNIHKANSEPS